MQAVGLVLGPRQGDQDAVRRLLETDEDDLFPLLVLVLLLQLVVVVMAASPPSRPCRSTSVWSSSLSSSSSSGGGGCGLALESRVDKVRQDGERRFEFRVAHDDDGGVVPAGWNCEPVRERGREHFRAALGKRRERELIKVE